VKATNLIGLILIGMVIILGESLFVPKAFSETPVPAETTPPANTSPLVDPDEARPKFFLKIVPYPQDETLKVYFTMADSKTNQVAANGDLRVHIYTTTSLSFGAEGSAPTEGGAKIKNTLYDSTFPIEKKNFHWEGFGSLLRVNDLMCRFVVPYKHFTRPVAKGKPATIELEFQPEGAAYSLKSSVKVSLY